MSPLSSQGPARRPGLLALLVVVPYLLLSVSWVFSNPPGAAPDEQHHLVKALGAGDFKIGRPGPPPEPEDAGTVVGRNASIARIIPIPKRLETENAYRCFAFKPETTAKCLPEEPPGTGDDKAEFTTPVGAYPPFWYVPFGWAALPAEDPPAAFTAGRLVSVGFSMALLWLGVRHLLAWLGRPALLGYVAAFTPMAVYSMSILTISGIEITGAAAVAAVVGVAMQRPESVHATSTHLTLAAAGISLVLGRQLGVVALGSMLIVLLLVTGRHHLMQLLRRPPLSFIGTVVGIGVATAVVVWWELTYDNPSDTGSPLDPDAVDSFLNRSYGYVNSSIGLFGWLDTQLPVQLVGAWIALWLLVVGGALLLGSRRDALIVGLGFVGIWALAFAIYSSVFYTVDANIQGRQFLGLVAFVVIVAGIVLASALSRISSAACLRTYVFVAVIVAVAQFGGVYFNGRRYAVGESGPLWFVPDAEWTPPLGFEIWLLLAAIGSVLLGALVLASTPRAIEPGESIWERSPEPEPQPMTQPDPVTEDA